MAALKITLNQLVLCALFGVIGINGKPPSAIKGGDLADDNEFPHHASLSFNGVHICGATIIDSQHIITAAHCVTSSYYLISNMTIIAGTNFLKDGTGDVYLPKNVTVHPNYLMTTMGSQNDIAIITLSSAITLDRRHKPAKLPTSDTPVETPVVACGWGFTSYPSGSSSNELRKLSLLVVPNATCRPAPYSNMVHETHICAHYRKGSGLCRGDSGGPLLNNGTLVGITSFVAPCGIGYPDVFTRVYKYVDWINEVTKMY